MDMLCVLCHLPEEAKLSHGDRTQNGGGLWGLWGAGNSAVMEMFCIWWHCDYSARASATTQMTS